MEEWLRTVRSKAQMTVMPIITAFTSAGGHKVVRRLCQSRESGWASLHNAYVAVHVCAFAKEWVAYFSIVSDFMSGLWRNRGFFCLQQLLSQFIWSKYQLSNQSLQRSGAVPPETALYRNDSP